MCGANLKTGFNRFQKTLIERYPFVDQTPITESGVCFSLDPSFRQTGDNGCECLVGVFTGNDAKTGE